ncbi:hypothetical protein J3F83DRAFT_747278, partial [Trichoderma novae-zelandiae]
MLPRALYFVACVTAAFKDALQTFAMLSQCYLLGIICMYTRARVRMCKRRCSWVLAAIITEQPMRLRFLHQRLPKWSRTTSGPLDGILPEPGRSSLPVS